MKRIIIIFIIFFTFTKTVNAELIDISENDKSDFEKYIPTISSVLIPGSGQIINQDYLKGIIFFTSLIALISLDIFYLSPNIQNNEKSKIQNSLIEILFFANRVSIPFLWLYNIGDAYTESLKNKKEEKKEIEFEKLSFNINLLSIKF